MYSRGVSFVAFVRVPFLFLDISRFVVVLMLLFNMTDLLILTCFLSFILTVKTNEKSIFFL